MLSLFQILEIPGQGCLPVCSLDSFRKQTIRLPKTVIFLVVEREREDCHICSLIQVLCCFAKCVCEWVSGVVAWHVLRACRVHSRSLIQIGVSQLNSRNWKRQSVALDIVSLILSCRCSCPSMTSRVKTGALATIASLSTFSFSFSDRYFFPNVASEAAAVYCFPGSNLVQVVSVTRVFQFAGFFVYSLFHPAHIEPHS